MGKKCVPRDRLSKGTNLHHSETADVVLYPDSGGMFLIPFSFYYSNRINRAQSTRKMATEILETKNGSNSWVELGNSGANPGMVTQWALCRLSQLCPLLNQNNRVKHSKLYGHLNQVPVQLSKMEICLLCPGYSFISPLSIFMTEVTIKELCAARWAWGTPW